MALGLYSTPHEDNEFTLLNAFSITFDGRVGGILNRKIYLRNDNTSLWYSDITIYPHDIISPDVTDNSLSGWYWKLAKRDLVPTPEEWGLVDPGNTLNINENIGSGIKGDINTFIPIWVQVKIPRGQAVQAIKDILLRIDSTENFI
ncbi:MAG: hypothetical protein DRI24_22950 [Deltaproteobacteria bacterium]|nr:MAG: hypothetical protein DRI24_22950 [Deltaproteobacteria bacterium]